MVMSEWSWRPGIYKSSRCVLFLVFNPVPAAGADLPPSHAPALPDGRGDGGGGNGGGHRRVTVPARPFVHQLL
jgi:hypothetical protein